MKPAVQICSRDFDATFFKLPTGIKTQIEAKLDRLGADLGSFRHTRLTGVDTYRLRVGDYRIIYEFDVAKGVIHLLAVGHRREIYR